MSDIESPVVISLALEIDDFQTEIYALRQVAESQVNRKCVEYDVEALNNKRFRWSPPKKSGLAQHF